MKKSHKSLPALAVSMFLSTTTLSSSFSYNIFLFVVYVIGSLAGKKEFSNHTKTCMIILLVITILSLIGVVCSVVAINKHNKGDSNRKILFVLLINYIALLVFNIYFFIISEIFGFIIFLLLSLVNFIELILLVVEIGSKRSLAGEKKEVIYEDEYK